MDRDDDGSDICAVARDDRPVIRDEAHINGLASDKVLAVGTEFGRPT